MANYKPLTELEKIAIWAAALQPSPDWEKLFFLSHPQTKAKTAGANVTHWKQHPRTQEELKNALRVLQEIKDKAREEGRKEERGRDSEPGTRTDKNDAGTLIDYSDPQQQRRKLNELVNTAEDQKEALDALKTIIATQKDDRDAARERKQIQAYLPVKCKSCPLYLAELQKT